MGTVLVWSVSGFPIRIRMRLSVSVWIRNTDFYPVLRIRDVYPGSDFFPSRIRVVSIPDPHQKSILTQKMVSKLWDGCSSRISDAVSGSWLFTCTGPRFPDPGVKKGTGSRIRNTWLLSDPLLTLCSSWSWSSPIETYTNMEFLHLFSYFGGQFWFGLYPGLPLIHFLDPDPKHYDFYLTPSLTLCMQFLVLV